MSSSTKTLIEGSACYGRTYEDWACIRQFVSCAIDGDGSILDVGCANGYFLKCMQKWCAPYVLEPFGIDVDGNAIRMAELMFPTYPGHFFQCDIRKMGSFSPLPIPPQFSYVFCSLLGPGADESAGESFVSTALSLLRRRVADGGRLVLGFYGASHSQLGSAQQVIERSALIGYVSQFYRYGLMLDRIVPNPAGSNHVVAWCDDCGT